MAATQEAPNPKTGKRTRKVGPAEWRIQVKRFIEVYPNGVLPDGGTRHEAFVDWNDQIFASTDSAKTRLEESGEKGEFRIIRVCSVGGKLTIRSVERTVYE